MLESSRHFQAAKSCDFATTIEASRYIIISIYRGLLSLSR